MASSVRMKVMHGSRRLGWLAGSAALGLTTVLVLLGLALRPEGAPVCQGDECGAPQVALPRAIRFGAASPRVFILLWIDLESVTSRQIFQQVTRMVATSRQDVAAELRLLHMPAGRCDSRDPRLGCIGARLVECAEAAVPGAGMPVAGVLFDLQWRPPAERTVDGAVTAVTGLGLDVSALLDCAAGSPEVEATLRAHAKLAAEYGLKVAPGGLVVDAMDLRRSSGFGVWLTASALRSIVGCLVQRRCEEMS